MNTNIRKRLTSYSFAVLGMTVFSLSAQDNGAYWIPEDSHISAKKTYLEQPYTVTSSETYTVKINELRKALSGAVLRSSKDALRSTPTTIKLPVAHQGLETFSVLRVATLHEKLAAKFPQIRSYIGTQVDHPEHKVRITVTDQGIFAHGTTDEGAFVIDPITADGTEHQVFLEQESTYSSESLVCMANEEEALGLRPENFGTSAAKKISDGVLRRFRFAAATTAEFSNFFINRANLQSAGTAEKKASVIAGLTAITDRLNETFEKEFALTLQLIPDNDKIVFLNPETDGLSNNSVGTLINQAQEVIDREVGFNNYDIGHGFATQGGGGIAQLQSPCTRSKARGASSSGNPVATGFIVDLVAHEIGHQFGAGHSQNNPCNRSGRSAVEPGSGSTIMSYAGICQPNVQRSSDDYYNGRSHEEINNFLRRITERGSCGIRPETINNTPPSIGSLASEFTIPNGTPFVLSVEATDADNDKLTYCWEQMDAQAATMPPVSTSTGGPLFRTFIPTAAKERYFPKLETILNNQTSTTWEVLPTVARTMNFKLTVRDNNALGGQTDTKDTKVTVTAAGPFAVTSQGEPNLSWTRGQQETITWDVAGTNSGAVNTQNVDILLSLDGGKTFTTVLAENTPNDGSQQITVPAVSSESCRLMVKPSDNIYFAVNRTEFSVGVDCKTYTTTQPEEIPDGEGSNGAVTSTLRVPGGLPDLKDLEISVDISHTVIRDLSFSLVHPDGTQIRLWRRNCNNQDDIRATFSDSGDPIPQNCPQPFAGTYAPVGSLAELNGKDAEGEWRLNLGDLSFNGRSGRLNSWSIKWCSEDDGGTLSTTEIVLDLFSVHPNPSNGQFTLNMGSLSKEDTHVTVYDLHGRKVYTQNVQQQQHTVTLNVAAGAYLVEVEQNGTRSIEKIIVR